MTPRLAWILLAAAAALGLIALVVAVRRDRPSQHTTGNTAVAGAASDVVGERGENVSVQLYFPGKGGRLTRETRELEGSADPSRLAARIVDALIAGPSSEPPYRPFPAEVTIGEVRLTKDGTVYVDLHSTANPTPPFVGSTGEMLTLYSLVNSVVENVPGARSVVVLWNGRQPRTFGGHIDTSRPLLPQPDLAAS